MKSDIFYYTCDLIFPKFCVLCGQGKEYLCRECIESLAPAEPRCIKCSRKNPIGLICPSCVTRNEPDGAHALYKFSESSRELIHQFKYNDLSSLAQPFGEEMSTLIKKAIDYKNFTVVPIPLTRSKKRYRGYNQAEILARCVSRILKIELTNLLIRVEAPHDQVRSLNREERLRNIRGVFSTIGKPPSKVILIDDVITTGATVREAAKLLKKAGTQQVVVFALAM